jgi:hypothetical protein
MIKVGVELIAVKAPRTATRKAGSSPNASEGSRPRRRRSLHAATGLSRTGTIINVSSGRRPLQSFRL